MYEVEKMALQIQLAYGQRIVDELRQKLQANSKEWLIEQLIEMVLDTRIVNELKRIDRMKKKATVLRDRINRLKEMALDEGRLRGIVERYRGHTRESLIGDGFLAVGAPAKGEELIGSQYRSVKGEELLAEAKAVFYGLLFGDAELAVHLQRTEQELLTLTLPKLKLSALDFLKAMTEMTVVGSWQDPERISTDAEAENVQITVEYGEIETELIGDGICATLSVINSLEINEQILYARMNNIEQTTLIE